MNRYAALLSVLCFPAVFFALPGSAGPDKAAAQDSAAGRLVLMSWNLENFFDPEDGGNGGSDAEFSPAGKRRWTWKRFQAKCDGIAKTVFLAGEAFGHPPEIIALQEVENGRALNLLLSSTLLRKCRYLPVHYDSPDRRGIDCAILYDASKLELIGSKAHHILPPGGGEPFRTRDILHAAFSGADGHRLDVLVNHHPSKIGEGSTERRSLAMQRLQTLCDSLTCVSGRVVAAGDFNDAFPSPPAISFCGSFTRFQRDAECPDTLRPSSPENTACGTIKFNGRWEKIDGVRLAVGVSGQEYVFDHPFLGTADRSHAGTMPLRTYSGPRYLGGLSDHYPVITVFEF